MKKILIIALTALFFGVLSCDRSDKYTGDIEMSVDAPHFTNVKAKAVYERCGMVLTTQIDSVFSVYDWTSASTTQYNDYVKANEQYYDKAVDLFERGVIDILTPELMKKHMCRTIILVDSCRGTYYATTLGGASVQVTIDDNFEIYKNYMALSMVGQRQTGNDAAVKELYLRAVVERMYIYGGLPLPEEFNKLGNPRGVTGAFKSPENGFFNYGFVVILRLNGADISSGLNLASSYIYTPDLARDLGDYAGFICHRPKAEREQIYTQYPIVKQKADAVKKYFSEILGVTLQEAQ